MNLNNPPGLPHCMASSEKGSKVEAKTEGKLEVNYVLLVQAVALPMQDPVTAEGPRRQ